MGDEQGSTFLAYISVELEVEWKRRETLDRRGAAAVTVAGSFTTLVLAFVTLLGGKDRPVLAAGASAAMVAGLVLFLAAGVLGLLAGRLRTYDAPDAAGYGELLESERWTMAESQARSSVAKLRLKTLLTLRQGNNSKVRQVQACLILQLLGVAALITAVILQVSA